MKIKELRDAIANSVNKNKNKFALVDLLEIAELSRKIHDNDEFKELSDLQYAQYGAICAVLKIKKVEYARCVRRFAANLVE